MSAAWAIIWFVAVLMFLVFIHEMGHFVTAKWRKVKVLEFGIGLPPRFWGIQRGETMYSLNWVPLGGFCKMLGEEDPEEEGSLASKGHWSRLLVLCAGSLVMMIFPLILFPVIYMVPMDVVVGGEDIAIGYVAEDSPAYHAGVIADDLILEINGEVVKTYDDMSRVMDPALGTQITMLVERGSDQIEFTMLARAEDERPSDQGAVGIGLHYQTLFTEKESYTPWEAVYEGAQLYGDSIVAMKDGIVAAFRREIPLDVGGVVAGGQITTEIAETGEWRDLAFWAGLLSFNLGFVNLLPIPALDGGRIVFVLIEMARRGKRVSPETEGKIHMVGFALLIALILLITYQDIDRIISGESLLP